MAPMDRGALRTSRILSREEARRGLSKRGKAGRTGLDGRQHGLISQAVRSPLLPGYAEYAEQYCSCLQADKCFASSFTTGHGECRCPDGWCSCRTCSRITSLDFPADPIWTQRLRSTEAIDRMLVAQRSQLVANRQHLESMALDCTPRLHSDFAAIDRQLEHPRQMVRQRAQETQLKLPNHEAFIMLCRQRYTLSTLRAELMSQRVAKNSVTVPHSSGE